MRVRSGEDRPAAERRQRRGCGGCRSGANHRPTRHRATVALSTLVGALLMSLNMLIETPGGFDYTAADCMKWMRTAGFTSTRAEHLVGPDSMVIAIK